ncbi:helix-turn-helix domain-containing protein [Halapricum desulfuricans]|uniref:Transcriptional regulator, contains HTH domain n=1 Tax=Halapricum desulfuricans TaxID=2841257 RepID=A0A897MWB0_9EURY|nr:helix-turn-helix domain-containing protein [Halapricum desulfuricans]QSG04774.1 Transcriptional regulator, contains HTH domain [Halapricum desulfuricans]
MNSTPEQTGAHTFDLVECSLYAEFDLRVEPIEWCPLVELEPPVEVQHQQFRGETCLLDVRTHDGEPRTVRITQECDCRCPSKALTDAGFLPRLTEVYPDRVRLGVHLGERAEVEDVVERLRSVAEQVTLRKLVRIGADSSVETTMDLTDLTDKQRETVTLAITRGYYRQPRRVSVGDIADELDISAAAVSQRLGAAESKVMRQVFDAFADGCE